MTATREASMKIMEAQEYIEANLNLIVDRMSELRDDLSTLADERGTYWQFTVDELVMIVKVAKTAADISETLNTQLGVVNTMALVTEPEKIQALQAKLREIDEDAENRKKI